MRLFALRGATSVQANSAEAIDRATRELVTELLNRNELERDRIVSCIFTSTPDLDAGFPAASARGVGLEGVALLGASEVGVPGAIPRVVRVLIHYYAPEGHDPTNVYLNDARMLRTDMGVDGSLSVGASR